MAKVAVITACYNAYPVMRQCIEALLAKSSPDVHVILVDAHSPDERTRAFVQYLGGGDGDFNVKAAHRSVHKWFTVLDAGRNLGTHNSWNHGFEHGVLGKGYDYCVKLDDDTVITTQDWDRLMVLGLEKRPDIAFLSADGTLDAKQLDTWDVQTYLPGVSARQISPGAYEYDKGDALTFEIPPRNIVDFHCVMFRVAEMMKWERRSQGSKDGVVWNDVKMVAPLGGYQGRVWLTNPEGDGDKRLYGGEELYMARKVRSEGRKIAYFRNVFCNHLDQHDRCQDYQLWKFCYGIMRSTDKPVDEWRKSGEMLRDMRVLIGNWACKHEGWARQYIVECVRRMGDIGEERDGGVLDFIAHGKEGINYTPRTDMPEVIAACEESMKRLKEKFKSPDPLAKIVADVTKSEEIHKEAVPPKVTGPSS